MTQPDPTTQASERLLLHLAKENPASGDFDAARIVVGDSHFCWDRALELAEARRLMPRLTGNLVSDPRLLRLAEQKIRHARWVSMLTTRWRYDLYQRELRLVLAQLAEGGSPILLMKGAALVSTLFEPDGRVLNDLDIWVPRESVPDARRALLEAGFEEQAHPSMTREEILRNYHQIAFAKMVGSARLCVDLHWRIYRPGHFFDLDAGAFVARAVEVEFAGARPLACAKEDVFLHLATQVVNDWFRSNARRAADLHALIASGLDWPALAARARATGACGACSLALGIAEVFGTLPSVEGLAAVTPTRRLAVRLLAQPDLLFARARLKRCAQIYLAKRLLDSRQQRRIAMAVRASAAKGAGASRRGRFGRAARAIRASATVVGFTMLANVAAYTRSERLFQGLLRLSRDELDRRK